MCGRAVYRPEIRPIPPRGNRRALPQHLDSWRAVRPFRADIRAQCRKRRTRHAAMRRGAACAGRLPAAPVPPLPRRAPMARAAAAGRPNLNRLTACIKPPASLARLAVAAAAASTSAAFCCVTWSMWAMAALTWSTPMLCSREAVEISCMMMVTCLAEPTTCSMVAPALRALTMPALTLPTEASISCLMSLAALALRWARLRTSPATTAKPRPCSPARAASTAAFKARMLVWKAMPSIRPMMSTIRRDEPLMSSIVAITSATMAPPLTATSDAAAASALAWAELSAFCLTVDENSSTLAAVCSRLAACASVRPDRSALPAAIWRVATAIVSTLLRTSDGGDQVAVHLVECAQQLADLVGGVGLEAARQVAGGDGAGAVQRALHRPQYAAAQGVPQEHIDQQADEGGAENAIAGGADRAFMAHQADHADGCLQHVDDAGAGPDAQRQRGVAQPRQPAAGAGAHDLAVAYRVAAAGLVERAVGQRGARHLVAVGAHPHRHIAERAAVFADRRDIRLDPVKVAVLAAVLDQAGPRHAGAQRGP